MYIYTCVCILVRNSLLGLLRMPMKSLSRFSILEKPKWLQITGPRPVSDIEAYWLVVWNIFDFPCFGNSSPN